jgi:predicted house-cleaning noncanonical NTP pyrophosphatase (MazG superfamily)
MLRLLWTISFALLMLTSNIALSDTIGNVVKQKGNASVERAKNKLVLKKNSGIEFKDNVRTGDGDIGIKFVDNTNVAISPHSSLVIDDFVYDPNSKSGSKLVMNVALGTVRYASGNIAKLNAQNVDIRTPTARIGVLGTAFSMTVDEVGKSLVILLPNADGTVGKILVESDAGQVILNQAFESTLVINGESNPSKPVILDLTLDQINNLLIIKPPKEKLMEIVKNSKSIVNLLDIDFLEYRELEKNQLDEEALAFTELDINPLDVDLLMNVLDQLISLTASAEMVDGRTSGFNKSSQINTLRDGSRLEIVRHVGASNIHLRLNADWGYQIFLTQGGIPVPEFTTDDQITNNIIIFQSE